MRTKSQSSPLPKKHTHGGRRKNAGRNPSGRAAYLVRMMPATARTLKTKAKEKAFASIGQFLEHHFKPTTKNTHAKK
jgi:hypothetical protein